MRVFVLGQKTPPSLDGFLFDRCNDGVPQKVQLKVIVVLHPIATNTELN